MTDYDCKVSIGICTYNQKDLCRNLVKNLLETGPDSMRIFVWDNNPSLNPLDDLKLLPRVEVIEDHTNSGYIIPNNRMAMRCRSEYYVVANDDLIVGAGWFEGCMNAFCNPKVAVAGPRPPVYGWVDEGFNGQSVSNGEKLEYIEGWWMMVPRHIIDRYGLFDEENLRVATCEDSHFCLSVRELGWEIAPIDGLPITHLAHQTKHVTKQYDWGCDNRTYLQNRWETYLKGPRKFPEHIVHVPAAATEAEIERLRWKYPYSLFKQGD